MNLPDYYQSQLKKIGNPHSGYAPTIVVQKEGTKTNCITLCDEAAQYLVEWLNDNYNVVLPEVSGINK